MLTEQQADRNRAARIFVERARGEYAEWGKLKFDELRRVRDSGKSIARVKNPYVEPATAVMLKGVGRNDPCPCGSGRKTKWCCG